ncbi:hypothetical protein Tfer_1282 [Thermincola ferriacetica]|nr:MULTISPECIES: cyclic lactone autoinducer peptide [Thermincola]ADG83591.1 conserved hypothetical protein [Thermincola potens JR]KNZ70136.1 hypothetical protein Tfer_1279 [Thermincola ferriacetica]KNZ70139.1 hypothetical protein Tfer_1282 [Thermincola ferriacetica]
MFRLPKTMILRFASAVLLFVAATGVNTACWLYWYQPKMMEE